MKNTHLSSSSRSHDFFDMLSAVLIRRLQVMKLLVQIRDVRFVACNRFVQILPCLILWGVDKPARLSQYLSLSEYIPKVLTSFQPLRRPSRSCPAL